MATRGAFSSNSLSLAFVIKLIFPRVRLRLFIRSYSAQMRFVRLPDVMHGAKMLHWNLGHIASTHREMEVVAADSLS